MTTLSKEDTEKLWWQSNQDIFIFAVLARADLVVENERLKFALAYTEALELGTAERLTAARAALAAAEAREGKLRAAIDVVLSDAEECEDHDGWLANLVSCEAIHQLDEAFSQPRADSTLREMIATAIDEFVYLFKRHVGGDGEFWLHELEDYRDSIRALAEKAKGK